MKVITDWINSHKVLTACIAIFLLIVQPFLVHVILLIPAPLAFMVTTLEDGELLTYVAGFEAFLGTVFLGIVAVRQNENANDLNKRMLENEEKRDAFERQPCIMISGGKFNADKSQEFDYILSFDFVNASKAFAQIWILDLKASGLVGTLTPTHSDNGEINHDAAVYYFSPFEIREITFGFNEKSFKTLSNTNCEFKLHMVNSLGEKFVEDIKFTSSVKDRNSFTISVASYSTTPLR